MRVTRPAISAPRCVRTTSWSMARVGTIRPTSEATGWAGPAPMDLERGSPTTGELGSASGLEQANGWGRGAIRGGGRMNGVGGTTSITITSASITLTFITTGGRGSRMLSTATGSTRGTVVNGRTIGAATSVHTRATPLTVMASSTTAPTMAISMRMFQNHPQRHVDLNNPISTRTFRQRL